MRCHFKFLSTVCLPAFASILLLTTVTSSFGQIMPGYAGDPQRRTEELIYDNEKPHAQPSPQKAPQHRPLAQPGAMLDHLKQFAADQKPQWDELLRAFKLAVNLLSGNETNLLSGNRPELLSKNKAALLSGNSPEVLSGNKPKILSDNHTPILSNNHFSLSFLSNLKIDIHIENTGNNNGNNAPPPLQGRPEVHVQPGPVGPVPQ